MSEQPVSEQEQLPDTSWTRIVESVAWLLISEFSRPRTHWHATVGEMQARAVRRLNITRRTFLLPHPSQMLFLVGQAMQEGAVLVYAMSLETSTIPEGWTATVAAARQKMTGTYRIPPEMRAIEWWTPSEQDTRGLLESGGSARGKEECFGFMPR